MVLLCFLLDLRSLSPLVFRDLKQSLFQLANYYAVSRPRIGSKHQDDRIGICYLIRNRTNFCSELKIAYNPRGNFNLRELHHALNTLPSDGFTPDDNNCDGLYMKLADLLSEKVIYSWASSDISDTKKVVLITSIYYITLGSVMMKALTDAAENSIKVEFILLQQVPSLNEDMVETMDRFEQQLDSLKNCSFQKCIPGPHTLHGLIKRWSHELQDESEEPLKARFVFKTNLIESVNSICCSLHPSFNSIVDEFVYSKTSRYHGVPLEHSYVKQNPNSSSLSIENEQHGGCDTIENSILVGAFTVLHMPSFQDLPDRKPVSRPVEFNVIQRTNLGSLSEGLVMGATYYVSPSTDKSPEDGNSELNNQIFQVVCHFLNFVDDGLVCYSNCNIETSMETSFRCYYLLLPSHKEQMLLRRLSALEEFLPSPGASNPINVSEEIEAAVQSSLKKMEVGDYNPLQHERGFHQKLNFLVKESLHLRAVLTKVSSEPVAQVNFEMGSSEPQSSDPELTQTILVSESKPSSCGDTLTRDTKTILQAEIETQPQSSELVQTILVPDNKSPSSASLTTTPCMVEEWEQLLVTELGVVNSCKLTSIAKMDHLGSSSPSHGNKELDQKTCRILERLEVPNRLKRKAVSPSTSSVVSLSVSTPMKKPLMPPYKPNVAADNHVMGSSQPMKPVFQRMRKKRW